MEPEYIYRKGVGWVPVVVDSITRKIGNYIVTVYDRAPLLGEYYWSGAYDMNIEQIAKDRWWVRLLSTAKDSEVRDQLNVSDGRDYTFRCTTVEFIRVE